jgi:hypothetical protein
MFIRQEAEGQENKTDKTIIAYQVSKLAPIL